MPTSLDKFAPFAPLLMLETKALDEWNTAREAVGRTPATGSVFTTNFVGVLMTSPDGNCFSVTVLDFVKRWLSRNPCWVASPLISTSVCNSGGPRIQIYLRPELSIWKGYLLREPQPPTVGSFESSEKSTADFSFCS